MIAELAGHSYRFLKVRIMESPATFEELGVVDLGRAYRPATPSGRPVISVVVRYQLVDDVAFDYLPSNVFLCWGHGSYGLTLGPGTGKRMSQMLRGDVPDVDLSPYRLPGS